MKLADKPCYPIYNQEGLPTRADQQYGADDVPFAWGLTFRERLIIALASNPTIFQTSEGLPIIVENAYQIIAGTIIHQADAIIKLLEEEKKSNNQKGEIK